MYPPDGLLTLENAKHYVEFDPHIIEPDPFASDAYIDEISQRDLLLLTTAQGFNKMNTREDESISGLNGRLRPRKSNLSPQSNKISRKTGNKYLLDKTIITNTLSRESRYKIDNLVKNSDSVNQQLLCPYCDKTFTSKQTASNHAHRIHLSSSKQEPFIDCLFCNHVESESNDIIRHMVDSHPNQYFACLDCHTRFLSTSDLAEHKLNVCEKQKLPYRSKLRQKSLEGKKAKSSSESDTKESFHSDNKEFPGGYNGIVISCELKPTEVHDEADIEDNITTNLILPSGKGMGHNAIIDKNAVIVLDDIQWNKRIPSNFSFHNTDADQILSRLGVVHRSLKTEESTKKDWPKSIPGVAEKFEKCFDTSFYSKIASNVQENLSKYLDGSFISNTNVDSVFKPKKSKNCVILNTAEGFPILLANEQHSRIFYDGYLPRAMAPKHKWKWDSSESDKDVIHSHLMERDPHKKNCIITYISNLDIWTQLCMRQKFENQFIGIPSKSKSEKQNLITKELKEILESRQIPTSSQNIKCNDRPTSGEMFDFPKMLGLSPTIQPYDLQPAVLSGEWVRPRCYVCCACGEQIRDSRTLSSHISSQHPNAQVQHYEIVGESLLNADILKHLYVPPSQTFSRTRPLRGLKECTKCKRPVSLEDLHQHMLDCAGDTPTVRRKCRYRPFGVRKRRPRLPDNRIRKKMRKDSRTGHTNDKKHMRPRPKRKSEVGDAETIRKMLADLPAKRHRIKINPLNSLSRSKSDRKRKELLIKRRHNIMNLNDHKESVLSNSIENVSNNEDDDDDDEDDDDDDDDDDDNLPLRPTKETLEKNSDQKESFNKKAISNRSKRKPVNQTSLATKLSDNMSIECTESNEPEQSESINHNPNRVNINNDPYRARQHSNRGGSNNRDDQRPGCSSGQDSSSHNSITPTQNVPLKHSIASLTADSETHDKAVQFHRLFLVQQECNADQSHLSTDRRVLFENEAVVTKLDKPPLHFNQRDVFDIRNNRKNKLSKQRKGLNDCIAMLKNKLEPNSDAPIPGHVSVQCGTDEPIDQEPFVIEQRFNIISSEVNNAGTPALPTEVGICPEIQKNELQNTANDNVKSCQSTCTENEILIDLRVNEQDFENVSKGKETITNKNIEDEPKFKSARRNSLRLENEPSQTELVPPRNTVIRKSPKMSMNYLTQQEEINMNSSLQSIETGDDKYSNNIYNKNNLSNDITSTKEKNDFPELNVSETQIGAPLMNEFGKPEKQCLVSTTDEVDENIDMSCKKNPDYPLAEFHGNYSSTTTTISPAHTNTNVSAILSTPLDLSGRKISVNVPERSSQDIPFEINNYDNYGTLDLSNKQTCVDQSLNENCNTIDNEPIDVVVDLSIRQNYRPLSQFNPSNFSTDPSIIDQIGITSEYDGMNENIPTDLTLKSKARSCSADLTQRSGTFDDIQDLSNRNTKLQETIHEQNNKIDYCNKYLPRDLSMSGINDNYVAVEDVSRGSQKSLDCRELNRKINKLDLASYEIPVNKLPQEVVEPPLKNSVEEFNLQMHENVYDYTLQSTNIESNSLEIQNLSQIQRDIHGDFRDTTTELNKNKETKEFMERDIVPAVRQRSKSEVNGSSLPFVETLTVIVPQEKPALEIEKSALKTAVASKSDYLPHYSSLKCKLTTQMTRGKLEGSTPVPSIGNVAVSKTKANTFCTSLSTYTSSRSTLDLNDTADINCRRSSVLSDNHSTSETENFVIQNSSHTSDILVENYDLTKEEIIDCDVESDTETARKIAMLPKELVEILGTMPIDHRNQLLNVLPQYVSTSGTATSTDTGSSCLRNNITLTAKTQTPVQHQLLMTTINCGENQNQLTRYRKSHVETNRRQRLKLDVASVSICPVTISESLPQSVILKTPTSSNDCYKFVSNNPHSGFSTVISGEAKRDVSILNHHSVSGGQNTIIDLTDDENIKVFHDEVQVIDDGSLIANHCFEKKRDIESLLEPLRPKGYSEQTASLRAVRIKAPSERNKQISSECSVQFQNVDNVGSNSINLEEQTTVLFRMDDEQEERHSLEAGCKSTTHDSHTDYHVPHLQNIALGEKSLSCSEKDILQVNLNENILINPSVILTPISIDKSLHTSQEITCENLINDSLEDHSDSLDQDIIIFDVNDTNDSNLFEESLLPITSSKTNAKCQSMIEESNDSSKRFKEKSDEDSEDDVTLAVIVQQKHLCQTKLTSYDDNTELASIQVNTENRKRKRGKKSKKSDLDDVTKDKEKLRLGNNLVKNPENLNPHSAARTQNFNTENVENRAGLNKEECGTEKVDSSCMKKAGSSRDTRKPVVINHSNNKEDLNVSYNNEADKIISESINMVQTCKEITTNQLMVTDKFGSYSTISNPLENIIIHSDNNQRRGNMYEINQSKKKHIFGHTENATNDDILLQVSQQSFLSLNENNIFETEISYEDSLKNRKCPKDCIAHNYKQYSVGNINYKNTDVLPTNETAIEPHDATTPTSLLNPDIISKKTGNKFKKQIMRDHVDNSQSKQLLQEIEKNSVIPLRRSRRGKSMFVDKKSKIPVVTNSVTATEIRTPLTKKQLIFSKLLLDDEKLSKIKLDTVVTKEPIVVINNVELSPQLLSSVCQHNVNSTQHAKSSKRKVSPQSKQKVKKLRHVDYEQDVGVGSTTNNQSIINNNDQNHCEEPSPDEGNLVLNSNNSIHDKDSVVHLEQDLPAQKKSHSQLESEIENNEKQFNILSPNHDAVLVKTKSTEKRKISFTVTEADTNHDHVNKKIKKANKNEFVLTKTEEAKRDGNIHCTKSKICNNNSETKNKTCYNRNVPVRRTRSKSVIEKSSTPLYDPYDINLEDMVERDATLDRRLLKSDRTLIDLSFVKIKPKTNNKREIIFGLNTEPATRDNDTVGTYKANEDTSDSDDSSKSDVPLKKLVEERVKRNLKINNRINAGQITTAIVHSQTETKSEKTNNDECSSSQQINETNKSEQFMESFGFFSERKPRKSNLIASKKISETFNGMANESDEINDEDKRQTTRTSEIANNKSNLDEDSNPKGLLQLLTKKSAKRGRKKTTSTKPLTTYCKICQKEFRRPDNYLRHQMTLLHIARLSEVEMKVKTTSVLEEPNYLVAYKQQLDCIKLLTDKTKRKKTAAKSPTTMDVPSLEEILANVNKSVIDQQLSRRNLSRDEALFIDCCELLKESHKPEAANNTDQVNIISSGPEQVTINSNIAEQVTITSSSTETVTIASSNTDQKTNTSNDSEQIPATSDINTIAFHTDLTGIDNNNENNDTKFESDVDSITAKNILESEEVRNLEKDLIIGLKEAAAFSKATSKDFQNVTIENKSYQNEEDDYVLSCSSIADVNCDPVKETELVIQETPKAHTKSKKNPEVKEKMYPDIIENIDIFEDKFDKIKRKCRSQAAAAKQVQPIAEPCTSHKGRKKSEKKKGKKSTKKSYQSTIPTKGALKGFDGLKVSIPTSEINISGIVSSMEYTLKKKKMNNSRKKKDEIETKSKHNPEHKVKSTQTQKIDVYEFMDNEEVELFEFRPSTLMERFKNITNKDLPSTSRHVPEAEKIDLTSESGSDGDDFVYDDYVCSDDETESSMLSCELGNGKVGTEAKRSSSLSKRRDVVEKNAVMDKIFKNNAVRTEKKVNKNKEQMKPKANLDQLFDSLLENEPDLSNKHLQKSPKRDELLSPKKQESVTTRKRDCVSPIKSDNICPRKQEITEIEPLSQKNHESDMQYESESPKRNESVTKIEAVFSKKQESSTKHKTTSQRKDISVPPTEYETIFSKQDEHLVSNKHESKLSKNDSKKAYVSRSSSERDDVTVLSQSGESSSKYFAINCKPSTSKKHTHTTIQEMIDSSSNKYDSHKHVTSTLNDYESTTSNRNDDGYQNRSKKYKMLANSYSNCSPKIYKSTSSNRHFPHVTKKANRDSPNLNDNSFRNYSKDEYRDESPISEIDENIDTISDCTRSTADETSSDEGGVARRRARRKCTVGKQNILAETWSSESEPESGPARPNSAESMESTVGRKKKRKKRCERQLYSSRRGISRQMPIKRQDVENRVALFKRNTSCISSVNGNGSRISSNGGGSRTNSISLCPSTSASTSTGIYHVSGSKNPTKTSKGSNGSHGSKPRPRSAAYYWSSDGDEEQEHVPQHGWIVGDSHKKLVTMLAHAKGRKRNHDDKRHIIE